MNILRVSKTKAASLDLGRSGLWAPAAMLAALMQFAVPAYAGATATYTASGLPAGLPATATAVFSVSGSDLLITLSASGGGTSSYGPGSGLSGLFFDIAGAPSLTPVSATVATGSTIVNTCSVVSCTGVTNVGGEWGYQYSSGGFTSGPNAAYGIASSGYLSTGLTKDIGNFNNGSAGTNLDGPASLDGPNFELLPSGVTLSGGSGGLSSTPVIESAVNFKLSGLGTTFSLADISNVSFQYGTSFSETNLAGGTGTTVTTDQSAVPEPASWTILVAAVLGLVTIRRRTTGVI